LPTGLLLDRIDPHKVRADFRTETSRFATHKSGRFVLRGDDPEATTRTPAVAVQTRHEPKGTHREAPSPRATSTFMPHSSGFRVQGSGLSAQGAAFRV